jgi:molybdate transport system permease protein
MGVHWGPAVSDDTAARAAERLGRPDGNRLLMLWPIATICLLVTPLLALLWRAGPNLRAGVTNPLVFDALRLSLLTAFLTTVLSILLGTPTAYFLARRRFPGRAVLNSLIDLPIVLPPAVAGLALLMAFGRQGLLGRPLGVLGISLPFTTAAVVIAQTFVAAPFFMRGARVGFAGVDRRLERIAATLGLSGWSIFWRVTLPLAGRNLLSGAIMTWARALGEFGATIMFAGNFQGRTQTMPLAIYMGLQQDLGAALTVAAILLLVSFSLLIIMRSLTGRGWLDA